MSDYASSLPVRTENDGDVVSRIGDGTTPSQMLGIDASGRIVVKLDDAAGNGLTSQANGSQQALDVGINVAGVQIDPRQIRALTSADVVSLGEDHNYGAVGATTLRVASQIGNASGAANFGAGATGAQTLRVEANQGAPGIAANGWYVKPTDGTNSQSFTAAGEAKVDITQPLPAGTNVIGAVTQSGAPWTADITKIGGAALSFGQALMAASIPVAIASDQSAIPVSQSGAFTVGLSEDHNYGAVGATTLRVASQIGNATGAADFGVGASSAQTLRVSANLAIAGAAVTAGNPVPVSIVSASTGTEVLDYATSASLAANASVNHDYTVTALKTLTLQQISASGSGKIKVEIKLAGSTKVVKFNSTASTNIDHMFQAPQNLAAGTVVRITITNLDKQAQDVYSTIEGFEF